MTTLRRFVATDLFKFNSINLDPLTETYSISSYLQYLAQWPDYFVAAESSNKALMGYGNNILTWLWAKRKEMMSYGMDMLQQLQFRQISEELD